MSETQTNYASYQVRGFYIRPQMMGAIRRYIEEGLQPGDFLTALICNNLRESVARADDENMRNLPAYVAYLYNEAPADCWGTKERMADWIKKKRKEREENHENRDCNND